MYSTAHYEDFKSSENLGNPRLNFLHLAVNDRGESIIRYFKYEELHEYSTKFKIIFRHVGWDQETSFNEEERSQKILLECPFKYTYNRGDHLPPLVFIAMKYCRKKT
jgi:hypothetical protein